MTRTSRMTFVLALVAAVAATGCSKKLATEGPNNDPTGSGTPGSTSNHGDNSSSNPKDPGKGAGEQGKHIWQDIHFSYDDASLDAEAKSQLSSDGDYLTGNSSVSVTIEGHCDERGSVEYNQALGEQRANSVRDYLKSYGVTGDSRMRTISYGKMKPIDLGHDETAFARNRRVHIVQGSR